MLFHNEYISYSLSDIIKLIRSKEIKWVGHVACTGAMINAHKILVRKSERKRPQGIHRENNIKKDLKK
jgi:hypothetical protein